MQTVKVLRPFNKTPQGDLADIGETIEVEDTRAQELAKLGLAETVKVAPAPENKQAPAPENKVAPDAITSERMRRPESPAVPATNPSEGVEAAVRQERSTRRTIAREKR